MAGKYLPQLGGPVYLMDWCLLKNIKWTGHCTPIYLMFQVDKYIIKITIIYLSCDRVSKGLSLACVLGVSGVTVKNYAEWDKQIGELFQVTKTAMFNYSSSFLSCASWFKPRDLHGHNTRNSYLPRILNWKRNGEKEQLTIGT